MDSVNDACRMKYPLNGGMSDRLRSIFSNETDVLPDTVVQVRSVALSERRGLSEVAVHRAATSHASRVAS